MRHVVIPSSLLYLCGRWDASFVMDIVDTAKARGVALTDTGALEAIIREKNALDRIGLAALIAKAQDFGGPR